MSASGSEAATSVANAVRDSYGRLLAFLSSRTRDIAAAEDALASAVEAALNHWPETGVPRHPEAWLLTAARRRLVDEGRRKTVRESAKETGVLLALLHDETQFPEEATPFPDERLKLLFVCAHPAIDEGARIPLMMQTVLGLDAKKIASAFLVSPQAMGQRLVRAKAKIRNAGISFEPPEGMDLSSRLTDILEGVYAAYGAGWEAMGSENAKQENLADEAMYLARLLCTLVPQAAEAWGLLALILFCESRRNARRAKDGSYVPLREQDTRTWNQPMRIDAERCLLHAGTLKSMGPLQLEAAIQSAHTQRALGQSVPAEAIVTLYNALIGIRSSIGIGIGRACALAEARGAAEGLAALRAMESEETAMHQPYWAALAHLHSLAGEHAAAKLAYSQAAGLTEDPAVRAFLLAQRAKI